MNKKEFTLARTFDAPKEKVWRAWTDPKMVKRWWGPKDFTAPVAKIDLKVGGKYFYCMRGAMNPGGELKDFCSTGTFQEIIPTERITATDSFADEKGKAVSATYYGMDADWPMEMSVQTTFKDAGNGKTKLMLRYPDISQVKEKDLSDMRIGWNQTLDKLAEVLK